MFEPQSGFDDRIIVTVAGTQHRDWTSYSIESDLVTPADGWQVTLGMAMRLTPHHVRPGARVSVSIGDSAILEGSIDSVRTHTAKGERTLTLAGRDLMGSLLDCSAPIFTQRKATVESAIRNILQPFNIQKVDVQVQAVHEKISIDPGVTAWSAIARICELNNCHAWFTPDGTFTVGKPDYTTPPVTTLILDPDSQSNVLSMDVERSMTSTHSRVSVLGQTHGNQNRIGMHDMQAHEDNTELTSQGLQRPLILLDGDVDTSDHAQKKAKMRMQQGKIAAFTIRAEVRGHRIQGTGPLWAPGQRVRVLCPADGLDDVYFLIGRTFLCNAKGQRTMLKLKEDAMWVS